MTIPSTDRLAALVAAKLQLVEMLLRLAERQLALVSENQTGGLLKVLAAKQGVLDQLQRLERELDPFRGENPEARHWRHSSQRAECQQQVELTSQLLAQVMNLEKQGEAAMLRRRETIEAELASVQSAADARHAYAGGRPQADSALQFEG
jgi:hypothetical protein